MAQYRKKPMLIEAVQWWPGTWVPGVLPTTGDDPRYICTAHGQLVYLAPGDWIIAEPDGRGYYPVKPDIFATTYDPVDAPEPSVAPAAQWLSGPVACSQCGHTWVAVRPAPTRVLECPACHVLAAAR